MWMIVTGVVLGIAGLAWYAERRLSSQLSSVLTGPPAPSGALPGVQIAAWPVSTTKPNPNSTDNAPMDGGTGTLSGVSIGDTFGLITGNPSLTMTEVTVDNPHIFSLAGKAAALPASSIALIPVANGTATFRARLSSGGLATVAVTVS